MDLLLTLLMWVGIVYGAGALLMFLYCLVLCVQAGQFGMNFAILVQATLLWPRYLPEFIKVMLKK